MTDKEQNTTKKIVGDKRVSIVFAMIVVTIVAALLGVTYAKYIQSIKAYSKFDIADFNAAIIGSEKVSEDPLAPQQFNAFGENISSDIYRIHPGLGTNDADKLEYPFIVANGTSDSDAAKIDIEYELRIRTTYNLPLNYEISAPDPDDPGNVKIYYAGNEKEIFIKEGNDDVLKWKEYTFYESDDPAQQVDPAKFTIRSGGFHYNEHNLNIVWPIETVIGVDGDGNPIYKKLNTSEYMQELEVFQIYVTVSSINNGLTYTEITVSEDIYGVGVVILYSDDGKSVFAYNLPYSSFQEVTDPDDENVKNYLFGFEVDNGVNIGKTQTKKFDYFTVKVQAPYKEETEDLIYKLAVEDALDYNSNGNTAEYVFLEQYDVEYRWVNIYYGDPDYGTYEVWEDDEETDEDELAQKLADYEEYLADPDLYDGDEFDDKHEIRLVYSYKWAAGSKAFSEDEIIAASLVDPDDAEEITQKDALFVLTNTTISDNGQVAPLYSSVRFELELASSDTLDFDTLKELEEDISILVTTYFSDIDLDE